MRVEFSKGERASKQDAEKVSVLTRPPWCAKTHLSPGSVRASLRDSTYRSVRLASSLVAALLGIRRVSARSGWAGVKAGHFEHPAGRS